MRGRPRQPACSAPVPLALTWWRHWTAVVPSRLRRAAMVQGHSNTSEAHRQSAVPLVDESHPRIIQSMKNNLSASRITSRVWHMYGCKFLLGLLTTKHYCSCSCDKHFYLSRISNTETMVEKQKHKYIFFNNQRPMPPVPDSAAISFASCSCVSMPMPRETATHHLCRSATTLQNWLNTVAGV